MKKLLITAAITLSLAACATNPDKVTGIHVSSSKYAGNTCADLEIAYSDNDREAARLYNTMNSRDNVNKGAAVVGMLLFWPALFFMKGKNPEHDARMAELKGRKVAIERAADRQNCSL